MKPENTLIQVTNFGMGEGDRELGMQLFINFVKMSMEENVAPKIMVFYNEGAKLLCTGSPAVEILKVAESKGIKLVACKTCLNHFNMADKLEVGIQGTMIDILNMQVAATKVINL